VVDDAMAEERPVLHQAEHRVFPSGSFRRLMGRR
jgi:hypothetical protein